ncbi:multicopper oxidase family protein [Paeniglutamicibacter antarcticus]|uniref:Multicopper oxidase family protein n=1 Tax=Paeniglutamicibacter antarcticus TaxID=494023 RepID=A0ABP9TUT6_9MICC
MSPMTRRQLLAAGAAGAAAVVIGGTGLWWTTNKLRGYSSGERLIEPQVLSSSERLLDIRLTAAPAQIQVGGRRASVQAFNNSLPGPTWRVRPGDTIRVALTNSLEAPTNLHVHGLQVSPEGNGDNPFVSVLPGETFDYEFTLAKDHPPGTYWYHPHHHGHVAEQIAAGLYGAIIVEDPEPVPVSNERVLVISDLSLDASGNLAPVGPMQRMMGREGEIVLVNGQVHPRLSAGSGERERWRIVNACPSRYLRLHLDGQKVRLLSRDFGRLPAPEEISEVVLAPGNRIELLVETREGLSPLVATPVDRGGMGSMGGGMMQEGNVSAGDEPVELLSLAVSGASGTAPAPVPNGPPMKDLREQPISARHTLDFGMGMGGSMMGGGGGEANGSMMSFTINGKEFDAERTDTVVSRGTVQEWTLRNSSPMDHPMHLHVWPMQVIESGTQDLSTPRWQDVVNIPAHSEVKVLISFEPLIGRTVYHCHILDHEDQGMMGILDVR